jgi:hypothetical protein
MKIEGHPLDMNTPYWICGSCAKERGGVYFKTASTAADVDCKWCKNEKRMPGEFIFPVVDYRWHKKEAA